MWCKTVACWIFGVKKFCWQYESMTKTIHGALSKIFCQHVRQLRENAKMTQRDLAAALNREHGMVARIELGERRVDFMEAYELFQALGADPDKEAALLMLKFKDAVVVSAKQVESNG